MLKGAQNTKNDPMNKLRAMHVKRAFTQGYEDVNMNKVLQELVQYIL